MSRRTYDTDIISIRQVNAYNPNNSFIPALQTLTADGKGGTFWAIPSSLGGFPAFNEVYANNLPMVADLSYNRLYLSSAEGLGILKNSTTKEITYYSKCFSKFDISGGNALVGYSNSAVTPTVKFAGIGPIRLSSDPVTNTIFFSALPYSAISTGIYGYSQVNVISNASTLRTEAIANSNNTFLTATSPSTVLNILGVGDIKLATNVTSNAYYITISTFTSAGYLDISGHAYGAYSSILSTVSTLFYDNREVGNATSSIMNFTSNVSTGIQQKIEYDNQNTMANFNLYINTTNTTNSNLNTVAAGLFSTISYTSTMNFPLMGSELGGPITGTTYQVSTTSFRLESMKSIIDKNAYIHLTYSPSLIFSSNADPGRIFSVSTCIQAGNTILSNVFVRPWMALGSNTSNLYNDTINLQIDNNIARASYTSTYTFVHRITSFAPGGIASCNIRYATSDNGMQVSLFGENFRGL